MGNWRRGATVICQFDRSRHGGSADRVESVGALTQGGFEAIAELDHVELILRGSSGRSREA